MIKHLWLTGILTAFSIFGIKAGIGLSSQIYIQSISVRKKIFCPAITLMIYLVLFFCLFYVITSFNLLNYLDKIINLIQYGMGVHIAVAAGLVYWGIKLLMSHSESHKKLPIRAGLLLILPCPVCAVVILLNLTLAYSLFNLPPFLITLLLFALFSSIVVATSVLVFYFVIKQVQAILF